MLPISFRKPEKMKKLLGHRNFGSLQRAIPTLHQIVKVTGLR